MTESETILPPFTVTSAAIDQIESLGGSVRIDVETGGCCGSTYVYANDVEADLRVGDARYGCPGAWLIVGESVADVLPGATLDYAARLKPPRFRVLHNPNTEHVCSCRRSFGDPWPGPKQPTCRSYLPMPWDESFVPPQPWQKQTGYGSHGETMPGM